MLEHPFSIIVKRRTQLSQIFHDDAPTSKPLPAISSSLHNKQISIHAACTVKSISMLSKNQHTTCPTYIDLMGSEDDEVLKSAIV